MKNIILLLSLLLCHAFTFAQEGVVELNTIQQIDKHTTIMADVRISLTAGFQFTAQEGKSLTLSIGDTSEPKSISVFIQDYDSKVLLEGGTYRVSKVFLPHENKKEEEIGQYVFKNGFFRVNNLSPGTYFVSEVLSPNQSYHLVSASIPIEIKGGDDKKQITLYYRNVKRKKESKKRIRIGYVLKTDEPLLTAVYDVIEIGEYEWIDRNLRHDIKAYKPTGHN